LIFWGDGSHGGIATSFEASPFIYAGDKNIPTGLCYGLSGISSVIR